mmetsp:Transcript_5532/g.16332  ORF Transcript_5532/g.16332 Transcript_5532/m.16332 type:complete len:235 (-) Transcript_5532:1805-2509(-)
MRCPLGNHPAPVGPPAFWVPFPSPPPRLLPNSCARDLAMAPSVVSSSECCSLRTRMECLWEFSMDSATRSFRSISRKSYHRSSGFVSGGSCRGRDWRWKGSLGEPLEENSTLLQALSHVFDVTAESSEDACTAPSFASAGETWQRMSLWINSSRSPRTSSRLTMPTSCRLVSFSSSSGLPVGGPGCADVGLCIDDRDDARLASAGARGRGLSMLLDVQLLRRLARRRWCRAPFR